MAEGARLEVITRDGWRRDYPVTKSIIHIGSDAHNDIVLDETYGRGAAPRHLQLIPVQGGNGYRAVNMSDDNVMAGVSGERVVPPRSFIDLASGHQVNLGEFTIVVHVGGAPPGAGAPTPSVSGAMPVAGGSGSYANGALGGPIGVRLNLPQDKLSPDRPINASITVINQGDETGVQFKIDVEGLQEGDYEIGPGPILFPGAEKEVPFRINHPRRPKPKAGMHEILIHVTAPKAYPGQSGTAAQTIEVLPFFSHRINLVQRG